MTRLQRMHAMRDKWRIRVLPFPKCAYLNEAIMFTIFGTPANPVMLNRANVVDFIIDVGDALREASK